MGWWTRLASWACRYTGPRPEKDLIFGWNTLLGSWISKYYLLTVLLAKSNGTMKLACEHRMGSMCSLFSATVLNHIEQCPMWEENSSRPTASGSCSKTQSQVNTSVLCLHPNKLGTDSPEDTLSIQTTTFFECSKMTKEPHHILSHLLYFPVLAMHLG